MAVAIKDEFSHMKPHVRFVLRHKRDGLCRRCNSRAKSGYRHCGFHLKLHNRNARRYRKKHKIYHNREYHKYYHLKAKYGLTKEQYDGIIKNQKNLCPICSNPANGSGFHVDHCHSTGKLRGIICGGCNVAIAHIKDNPDTARAIADYLDKHSTQA